MNALLQWGEGQLNIEGKMQISPKNQCEQNVLVQFKTFYRQN